MNVLRKRTKVILKELKITKGRENLVGERFAKGFKNSENKANMKPS